MRELGSYVRSTPYQKQANDPDCSAKMCTIRVAVPGRNTGFVSPSSSSRKHHCPRQQSRDARIKVPLAGLFAARPKTYDLYAVCVAGLNRLIPLSLSEFRVVYGQAPFMPQFDR
jgi:hypothetical protein